MLYNMKEQSRRGGTISRGSSRDYYYWSLADPQDHRGNKKTALKDKCLGLCLQNPGSGGREKSEPRRNRWHKITIS